MIFGSAYAQHTASQPPTGTVTVKNSSALTATQLKNLGIKGNNSGIRQVKGTAQDARNLFNQQVNQATIREVKPGVFKGTGWDGNIYTFRPVSSDISMNVPTIDVQRNRWIKKD